jgi:hypothetical protein
MEPEKQLYSESDYQGYEGSRRQNTPSDLYDDNFVEALSQRIAAQNAQKVRPQSSPRAAAAQRLALAIISVIALTIAIGTISFSSWTALPMLGIFMVGIVLINAIFNNPRS